MLFDGDPILGRYHSTSGGRTLDNEDAFEGDPAYPYLQGVPNPTEKASPFYRWKVRFTLKRLEAILRHAGWWRRGRLARVISVDSRDGYHYPDIVFEGRRGRFRSTAEELRDVVRDVAPHLFPNLYPPTSPVTGRPLPETFPSNRLRATTRGNVVHVVGRGWGHGSGMSQWGAHGMAERGASYSEILEHYYTGALLGSVPGDEPIEVGVATALPEARVTGGFTLVDGRGRTLVQDALGTWIFRPAASGAITIDPPRGFGVPLEVGIVERPRRVAPGEMRYVKVALSRPARLQLRDGVSRNAPALIKGAGVHRLLWIAPRRPGEYKLSIIASSGRAQERDSAAVVVTGSRSHRAASDDASSSRWLLIAIAALAAVAVVGVTLRAAGKIDR